MTTHFEPLTTDYEVEWDTGERFGPLAEGETFEHGHIALPNGYTVSIARSNLHGNPTIGYENGHWEAVMMKPNPNAFAALFGHGFVPAPELDDLATHNFDGIRMVGDLDNAGISNLLTQVAQRPPVPVTETSFLDQLLDTAGVEVEVTPQEEFNNDED